MSNTVIFHQFQDVLDQNIETITRLTDALLEGDSLTKEEIKDLILRNHKEICVTPREAVSPRHVNRASTEEQLKLLREEITKMAIIKESKETQTDDSSITINNKSNKENSGMFAVRRFQPQFRPPNVILNSWK
jgi:hypothetical protein